MYIERIQALNEKAVNDYRNKITEQPDFLKTIPWVWPPRWGRPFIFFEKKVKVLATWACKLVPSCANLCLNLIDCFLFRVTMYFEIGRPLWPLEARQKHSRALRTHTGSDLCRCFWNPWSFMLVRSSWVKMGRMGAPLMGESRITTRVLQKKHLYFLDAQGYLT